MRRTERGGVFIVSLAVLTGLVVVLAGAAATQRVVFRQQINLMESRRARIAAESAIQQALATLQNQAISPTTLQDEWAELGSATTESFTVDDVTFRIQILDAASFVNINTATEEQLERMPFTIEQIESLLDWREAQRQPRPQGAKDEYYNALPRPYNAKLRRFDSVDELLQVKGFTAKALFEPQENVVSTSTAVAGNQDEQPILVDLITTDSASQAFTEAGTAKAALNNASVQQMVQQGIPQALAQNIFQGRPYTRMRDVMARIGNNTQAARIILDNYRVTNNARQEGRINVNTASESVLNTVPGLTPDLASAIVSRQSSGFATLGDILDVPGMTGQALQQSIDFFEVSSQTFIVRVIGTAGRTSVALEATVGLVDNVPKVLKIEQPPFADAAIRWRWEETPTNQITLRERSSE